MKTTSKLLSTILVFTTISMFTNISVKAEEAVPISSNVLVNGQNVNFDAYCINDNNYFKLRDLAYVLNMTEKQFSVGYDEVLNTVSLMSRQSYTAVGGEMETVGNGKTEARQTNSIVVKDGYEVRFQVYNINDNNYFKLRDIGEAFDFTVDWDGDINVISIDTKKGYAHEEGDNNMNNNEKDTYYKDYIIGDKIEVSGIIDSLEEFRRANKRSKEFIITARFTDDNNNKWIIPINFHTYGISDKSDYDPYVGKHITINGIYEGYSKPFDSPCITAYDLKDTITNKTAICIRKVEELMDNGDEVNPKEPLGENYDMVKSSIQRRLEMTIQMDMIEGF